MEFIYAHELERLTKAKHTLDVEIADISSLQKIHLNVKDAAKSANFLSFVFTVPKPEVPVSPDGDETSFVITMGNMQLELHQKEQEVSEGPQKATSGQGLKFTTQTASIEAVRRALAIKNVQYSHTVPGNFHALEFTDPDGFRWEVVDTGRNPALALATLVRKDEPGEILVREDFLAAPKPKTTAAATVEAQSLIKELQDK